MAPVSSKEFLDSQTTLECRFTMKLVRDMIKTYNQNIENKRLVEEVANYFKIIEGLSKGHSPTQNNEHHNQLQKGHLQWEHQQYNKNIRNIRKQQSK